MQSKITNLFDQYEVEYKILNDWITDVIEDNSSGLSLDPTRENQRTILFGYLACIHIPVRVNPLIKPGATVAIILNTGRKNCGQYRYWFIFDKDAGFVILEIYTYKHKNVGITQKR